jgi:ABC-2 type transport system ATP-binding protein
MIVIESLSKRFGPLWALRELSLNIRKGEFYCLLGPNGAGKTTTLKVITGLMKATSGKIFINDLDLQKNYLEIKKILGLVPDTPFLYENLTPYEFLGFVGDVFGIKRDVLVERVNYYFEIFNLKDYKDALIKELSHGMRQKIVYISNFIHSPLVYLIDEPLVGLDPYSIHLIKKLLKEESRRGKTILMCTHILSIAEELADRIGILNEGRLISEGSPHQLKEKLRTDSLEKVFLKLTKQYEGTTS